MSQHLMLTGIASANKGCTNVKSKKAVVVEQELELELLGYTGFGSI